MHILIGALVGGALFTVSYIVAQKIAGKPLTWHAAVGAFAGGVVTGAMAATTLGASLVAEGGMTAVATIGVEGGAGSATEQVVDNLLDKKPVMDGVVKQAVVGAATAPLFYGVFKGAAKFLPDAEKLAENPVAANVGAVLADGKSMVNEVVQGTEKALSKDGAKAAQEAARAIENGGKTVATDAGKAVAEDAGKAVPKVIRGPGGKFVKNPEWKPVVADAPKVEAPKVEPVTTKPTGSQALAAGAKKVFSHPALKDTSHHVRAGSGLAASGVVLTAIDKVKGMMGGSSDSSSSDTSTSDTTAASTPAGKTHAPSNPGNVQVSVPTNGSQPVNVTISVGGNQANRGPVTGPVTNVSRLGNEDSAQRREGIAQAIGKLGGNP